MLSKVTLANAAGEDIVLHEDSETSRRLWLSAQGLVGVGPIRRSARVRPQAHGSLNETKYEEGRPIQISGEVWSTDNIEGALEEFRKVVQPMLETLDYGPALLKWQEGSGEATTLFERIKKLAGLVSFWQLGEAEPTEVVNLCPTPTFAGGQTNNWNSGSSAVTYGLTVEPSTTWHGPNTTKSLRVVVTNKPETLNGYLLAATHTPKCGEGSATDTGVYLSVVAGKTYTFGSRINFVSAGVGNLELLAIWRNSKGEYISQTSPVVLSPKSGEGQHPTITATAPAEASFIELIVAAANVSGGCECYLDEFQIAEGATLPAYKDPAMPGYIWSGKAWESTTLKAPVAKDSFGSNNGEYTGGVTLGEPGLLTGDTSTSVKFDGSTGYARVPHAASLSPASAITLGAVVDPTASGNQVLIGGNVNTVNYLSEPAGGSLKNWKADSGTLKIAPGGGVELECTGTVGQFGAETENVSKALAVLPGQTYGALAHVTTVPSAPVSVWIEWFKSNGSSISSVHGNELSAPGTSTVTAVAPAEAAFVVVAVLTSAPAKLGDKMVVHVMFTHGAPPTEYADGNTLGHFWSGKAGESTTVLPYYALELVSQKLKLTLPIGSNGELTTLESPGTVALNSTAMPVGTYDGSHLRLYLAGVQVAELARSGTLAETPEYLLLGNGFAGKQQASFFDAQALAAEDIAELWSVAHNGPQTLGLKLQMMVKLDSDCEPLLQEAAARLTYPVTLLAEDPRAYSQTLTTQTGAAISGGSISPEWLKTGGMPQAITSDATHIYWADHERKAIGRAEIGGAKVELEWIKGLPIAPLGICVTATFVYWTTESETGGEGGFIGRAEIGGAKVETKWFSMAGTGRYMDGAITTNGTYLYFATQLSSSTWHISRCEVSGLKVEYEWIHLGEGVARAARGLAVSATNIYWIGSTSLSYRPRIGRAEIGGAKVELEWISETGNVAGLAITSEYIYWLMAEGGAIYRAPIASAGGKAESVRVLFAPSPGESAGTLWIAGTYYYSNPVAGGSRAISRAELAPAPSGSAIKIAQLGTRPSPLLFKIFGPITNPTITSSLGGAIVFAGVIPSGSYLEVDAAAREVTMNGSENSLSMYQPSASDWTALAAPANPSEATFTLSGSAATAAYMKVEYRAAY